MRRVGVGLLVLALLGTGFAAAAIREEPPPTTVATTTDPATTDATPTTPLDTTASTTTATDPTATTPEPTSVPVPTDTLPATTTATSVPVTTAPSTTAVPSTTAPATTAAATTTQARVRRPVVRFRATPAKAKRRAVERAATLASAPAPRSRRCLLVGAVWLAPPHGRARVLGPAAQARGGAHAATGRVAYPASGAILTASGLDVRTSGCGRAASGRAAIEGLSLLGGAVRARSVRLDLRGGRLSGTSGVAGLKVAGGVAEVQTRRSGRDAPQAGALVVRLVRAHGGVRAGTTIVVGFALVPPRKRVKHDEPLTVTPPLGLGGYVFPVVGEASYGDTYGAFRGDVPGNWHHGDDIFAKLGAPVVAVASGTLNRVGWERLGGWRLWLRDSLGNEFYYAHLAAYSPRALRSNVVEAGEVIGFIGNTGDAFTTPPHLHFEIHPRSLLHLHYNGAVDPTGYLGGWRHLTRIRAPRPAHPRFPRGALRREAAYVWRALLAARGLGPHPPAPKAHPRAPVETTDGATPSPGARAAPPAVAAATPLLGRGGRPGGFPLALLLGGLGGGLALIAAAAGGAVWQRERLRALAVRLRVRL